jgi:hypothetical protein
MVIVASSKLVVPEIKIQSQSTTARVADLVFEARVRQDHSPFARSLQPW